MIDDLEKRLRALRPAPLSPVLRARLERAVSGSGPSNRQCRPPSWVNRSPRMFLAATLVLAITAALTAVAIVTPVPTPQSRPIPVALMRVPTADSPPDHTMRVLMRYLDYRDTLVHVLDRQSGAVGYHPSSDDMNLLGDTL